MFKKTKEKLDYYKEDNKSKALQITALVKENDQLKLRLNNIMMNIEKFNHINGNAFSLLNVIKSEAKYE